MTGEDPIDHERCAAFEAHRMQGGDRPLEEFLPRAGEAAYAGTLEELVAMDLEIRWKRWAADGGADAHAPDPGAYESLLAGLADAGVAERLAAEHAGLRARFAAPRAVREGARIGRYLLLRRAGRGAQAEVWRARDETLGRDVAVKLPRPELADAPGVVQRLLREARSAARLRHPGIVPVHEAGVWAGGAFVVSDFVEGETLAAAIGRRVFEPDEAAAIVLALAEALDYAHAFGVVHRDVKPANVILDASGRPLLADFGLARLAATEATLTRPGDVLGTPAYMAPEQVRGDAAEADARTDVYALGVVLYEQLARRLPFEGSSAESVLYAVVHEDPVPLRRAAPGVPRDLGTICLRAMARDPAARYPTARALAEDLRRYLARQPILARPAGLLERTRLWVRREPALSTTIAASVAALLATGVLAFSRVTEERDRAQAHLAVALAAQAESLVTTHSSEWYDRALAALREAAAVDPELRDARRLRDLALRCHASVVPSFRRVAVWSCPEGEVRALAISPDAGRAAMVCGDEFLWLRTLPSGEIAAGTRTLTGPAPACLAFLPGGRWLAGGFPDGSVRVFDTQTTGEHGAPGAGAVASLAVAPSGRRIVAGRATGAIDVFDFDGALVRVATLPGHPGGTFALDVSDDGARLASGGADARVRVWDLATGEAAGDFAVVNAPRSVDLLPSGDEVAWGAAENAGWGLIPLASPGDAQTWNGAHLAPVSFVGCDARDRVVTASSDGTVRAWTRKGVLAAVASRDDRAPVTAAAVVPGTSRVLAAYRGGELILWDLVNPPGVQLFAAAHSARWQPRSRRLLCGNGWFETDADGQLRGAHAGLGMDPFGVHAPHRHPGAGATQPWGVAASPDGRAFAVVSHDGGIRIWREIGAEPRVLRAGGPLSWTCAFSPDGRRLAVGAAGELTVWDALDGRLLRRETCGDGTVVAIAFHPALPRLLWATDAGAFAVTDAGMLGRLADFPAGAGRVHDAAFSPCGERLVAGCDDGTAAVWDGMARRLSGAAPRGDAAPAARLPGGGGRVWAVAWDPLGRWIATGTEHGIVTLHCARTLSSLATLTTEVRAIRSLSFDEKGECLAAACYGTASMTWHLPTLRRTLASMNVGWGDAK